MRRRGLISRFRLALPGGAYFSLVGKVAKAPSRDVPSLENPSYVLIYLRYDLIDWLFCGVLWAASGRSVGGCALLGDFDWPFGTMRSGIYLLHQLDGEAESCLKCVAGFYVH